MKNQIILEGLDFDDEILMYENLKFKIDIINARCDCEIANIVISVAAGVISNFTYDSLRGVLSTLFANAKPLKDESVTKVKIKIGKKSKEMNFSWELSPEQKDKVVDAFIEELKTEGIVSSRL
ncbi:MAG: hypothetical protein FWD48_04015 [Oscillospiraceae bacterium]|nr:hypothetical protein [Oscillospiraceae bacterium]